MEGYDVVFFIWLVASSIILFYMIDKTDKLKDTVVDLNSYINVTLDPQIKRIRQLVDNEIINKNVDTSINKTDHDKTDEVHIVIIHDANGNPHIDRCFDNLKSAIEYTDYLHSQNIEWVDLQSMDLYSGIRIQYFRKE